MIDDCYCDERVTLPFPVEASQRTEKREDFVWVLQNPLPKECLWLREIGLAEKERGKWRRWEKHRAWFLWHGIGTAWGRENDVVEAITEIEEREREREWWYWFSRKKVLDKKRIREIRESVKNSLFIDYWIMILNGICKVI